MATIREVAQVIKEKGNVLGFTGAGISVDSGIPAFRGGQGLWEKYDPMEYAHIGSFMRHPEKVWMMLREMGDVILSAQPSLAHKGLAALEKAGLLNAVITQNVDGLHQVAGNSNVIEYHGNHRKLVCPDCMSRIEFTWEHTKMMPYPKCDQCNGPLKPDVVFFGEQIPRGAVTRSNQEVNRCNVMLIIGTSGVVYPAADIPFMARARGTTIIEINVSPTPFTEPISNYFLEGNASRIMPEILDEIGLQSV